MIGLLGSVIPMLVILAFIGGFYWAGTFCKSGVGQFFMGMLLGFGIVCGLAAVAFAGCCVVLSSGAFK